MTSTELFELLTEKQKAQVKCHVVSWLSPEDDFRELFKDIRHQLKKRFDEYNNYVKKKYKLNEDTVKETIYNYYDMIAKAGVGVVDTMMQMIYMIFKSKKDYDELKTSITSFFTNNENNLIPLFHLEDGDNTINDIQMDGYYYQNSYIETLFSPNNVDVINCIRTTEPTPTPDPTPSPDSSDQKYLDDLKDSTIARLYYVDFQLSFSEKSIDNLYNKNDFVDVLNIGNGPYQNNPKMYTNQWLRRLNFQNVWDRHTCIIYSSIAEQSNHGYIGNSDINFNPIKYYRLKATDQRFWIEFYSSSHHNIPVKLPPNESFCIEMQFLPYNKMLNV